jgi:hypothetical protein
VKSLFKNMSSLAVQRAGEEALNLRWNKNDV